MNHPHLTLTSRRQLILGRGLQLSRWAPQRHSGAFFAEHLMRRSVFDDLCSLLDGMGFEKRVRGSHYLFRKAGVEERINLQREGQNAKPYQVKQVRTFILKYRLGEVE